MKKRIISGLFLLLFIILMILIKYVDVKPIGPNGSLVGFSTINAFFHNLTGVNYLWYEITDTLGIIAILICVVFGLIGFIQLINRKKLFSVDLEIIALGVLFIITIGLYVLFNVVTINLRPIIMPGDVELEASFPSSHTMLAIVVFGSVSMIISKYVGDNNISKIIKMSFNILIVIAIIGRLLSGVHWFTDIVGAILMSISLLLAYNSVIKKY